MTEPQHNGAGDKPEDKLSLWQVIGSVFAAAFGVQSDKNRQRDFTRAKPSTYIIAGILFTLAFILVIFTVVKVVLSTVAG
jgi:hypothetical protein